MVLAVIKNDAGKSVIYSVVNIVAGFAFAPGFADDFGDGGGSGGDDKPARFSEDFNVGSEEPVDLRIYFPGKCSDGFDVRIVSGRETAPDVEDLDFVSARFGLLHDGGGQVQGLDEILKVGALASNVKTDAFDNQAEAESLDNQVNGFARVAAKFG